MTPLQGREGTVPTWRTEYCVCAIGRAVEAEDREREADDRWSASGVSNRAYEYTLASSPLRETDPALIASIEAVLATGEDAFCSSWLFWGDYGTGKTGLAVAIARAFVYEEGATCLFRTLPDLMTELRATYNRRDEGPTESELLDKYANTSVFVLDDLGAEQVKDSGWLEDRLYQIIGRRHGMLYSPTIFTSNLSPAQLGARIGERNMWRVTEMCEGRVHHVEGPNLRKRS